jgi:hypothetical protein
MTEKEIRKKLKALQPIITTGETRYLNSVGKMTINSPGFKDNVNDNNNKNGYELKEIL